MRPQVTNRDMHRPQVDGQAASVHPAQSLRPRSDAGFIHYHISSFWNVKQNFRFELGAIHGERAFEVAHVFGRAERAPRKGVVVLHGWSANNQKKIFTSRDFITLHDEVFVQHLLLEGS